MGQEEAQPGSSELASPKVRNEVFARSYDEVLLFLKHEDDKINRVLTALAFLTAAAVTLYIFSRGNQPPETLDLRHTTLSAADFFFASYIVGLVLALLAAMAALDPTSLYPRAMGDAAKATATTSTEAGPSSGNRSLLYFRAIARGLPEDGETSSSTAPKALEKERQKRWEEVANAPDPKLRDHLASSFQGDARRLSHRAMHKVYRFSECNAFVNAAVVSLGLLGVARVESGSSSLHWGIIVAILVLYSWSPLYDYILMAKQNFPDIGYGYSDNPWTPQVLQFFGPPAVLTTFLLLKFTHYWPTLVYALGSTVVVRLLLLHGQELATRQLIWLSRITGIGGVAIAIWLFMW